MSWRGTLLALLVAAGPAGAGGVFDSGWGNWTPSGYWHRALAGGCVAPHTGAACAYYGNDATCTYADQGQPQDASLTSGPVLLNNAATAFLSFWLLYTVQSYDPQCQDQLWLEISGDGVHYSVLSNLSSTVDPAGGSPAIGFSSGGGLGGPALWRFHRVDLSAWLGNPVYVRFHFLSSAALGGDALCGPPDGLDDFLGYAIDDVDFSSAPLPPVAVSKSVAPALAAPGATFTFSLAVTNTAATAASVQVWDTLPPQAVLVAAPGAALNGSVASWSLPSLAAGAQATVQLVVRAPATLPGPLDWVNTAAAQSSLTPTAVLSDPVLAEVRQPVLRLTKSVNAAQMASGDQATYALLVENDTSVTQSALSLQDALPSAFSLSQAYPPASSGSTWILPPLAPGAVASVSLWGPLFGQDGQVVVNTAQLAPGTPAAVTASATVVLHKPVQPSIVVQAVYPNPAPSRAAGLPQDAFVVYTLNTAMPVTLDVFTVAGEKVRSLAAPGAQGLQQVAWDLRNGQGRRVASGIYVYRLWSSLQVQPQPQAGGVIAVAQ